MLRGAWSRTFLAVGVLVLGASAEALSPSATPALTVLDFAVGAVVGVGGAWLLPRAAATPAVAFAVLWFLGTLTGATSAALSAIGIALVLAYRGPLLQLLLDTPSGRLGSRSLRCLAAASWLAGLLPTAAARPATTGAAALVAATAANRARHQPADRRLADLGAAAVACGLAGVWGFAILRPTHANAPLIVNDVLALIAGVLSVVATSGRLHRSAVGALVIELSPGRYPGQPITTHLARVLSDPALQVRYRIPGFGWVDEQGRTTDDPLRHGVTVTRAGAPAGGEVALVHGDSLADPGLAQAAAAAAVLALDSARLDAELRARTAEVRASRRRLLTVADEERRSLEAELAHEVLTPLRGVERLLASSPAAAAIVSNLRDAMAEIRELGSGLSPALARSDLAAALQAAAARCPAHTTIDLQADVQAAPEHIREAVWYLCSEALANVARHAQASRATVRATIAGSLVVEISDDGCGGATITRGLQGLADRIAALSGTLQLTSPPGGPTVLRAELPLSDSRAWPDHTPTP